MKRTRKKVITELKKTWLYNPKPQYGRDKKTEPVQLMGHVAQKFGMVVGQLGCPNCGWTALNREDPNCPVCKRPYFPNRIDNDFITQVSMMIERFEAQELPDRKRSFSSDAEISAGFRQFIKWLQHEKTKP